MKKLILVLSMAVFGVSTSFTQTYTHHPDVPYAEVQAMHPHSPQPIPQSQGGFTKPFEEPMHKKPAKVQKPTKPQHTKPNHKAKNGFKKAKKPAVVCPQHFGLHYDKLGRPYCEPIKIPRKHNPKSRK